ncbi:hypothetical protein CIPAW_11G185400 [Carya illinoinensis]|uniref:Uncharacterized protein n=1 Tax=Carya illinoinensis TaxID=32201 RepID=A0A8T1P872_CARIL|nr:hypothetical protein CIPAW_11G185400 [Carya illinoinensis]
MKVMKRRNESDETKKRIEGKSADETESASDVLEAEGRADEEGSPLANSPCSATWNSRTPFPPPRVRDPETHTQKVSPSSLPSPPPSATPDARRPSSLCHAVPPLSATPDARPEGGCGGPDGLPPHPVPRHAGQGTPPPHTGGGGRGGFSPSAPCGSGEHP